MSRTLKRIAEVLRRRRHHDPHEVARWLGRVVNGWLNYYAVPTSSRFLRSFTYILKRIWLKALRRRSQRDRFSWRRLQALVEPILAQAVDPTPVAGTAVRRQIPEVGAGWFNDHVRICAGGAGKPVSLPRPSLLLSSRWRSRAAVA